MSVSQNSSDICSSSSSSSSNILSFVPTVIWRKNLASKSKSVDERANQQPDVESVLGFEDSVVILRREEKENLEEKAAVDTDNEVPTHHRKVVLPQNVKIPRVEDEIDTGDVATCVASYIGTPSKLYLVVADDFHTKMEKMIRKMTHSYNRWCDDPVKKDWLKVSPEHLEHGAIVSALAENSRGVKEWLRTKVIGYKNPPCKSLQVVALDLGREFETDIDSLAFMHCKYCLRPTLAIKCRLALSSDFDDYHNGKLEWTDAINDKLWETLYNRTFEAKFVRCVVQDGEMIWEVSIQGFTTPQEGDTPYNISIQEWVIAEATATGSLSSLVEGD